MLNIIKANYLFTLIALLSKIAICLKKKYILFISIFPLSSIEPDMQ